MPDDDRAAELLAAAEQERADRAASLLTSSPAPEGPLAQPVPDHTASGELPPADQPPKAARARPFSKLGTNKKARSGVRALTDKDRDKIVGLYVTSAMAVMMVRPPVAQVMAEQADTCADAWVELSKENDGVRRALLFLIEGGAWGAVIVAHAPIALAMLPPSLASQYNFLVAKNPPDTPDGANPQ